MSTNEIRTAEEIAADAVDRMMTEPDSLGTVRGFLVGLMVDSLRLSMTPEWDMEDNFSMTEHVVGTLASHLPGLSREEVLGAADGFGLDPECLDDPWYGIALNSEDS